MPTFNEIRTQECKQYVAATVESRSNFGEVPEEFVKAERLCLRVR